MSFSLSWLLLAREGKKGQNEIETETETETGKPAPKENFKSLAVFHGSSNTNNLKQLAKNFLILTKANDGNDCDMDASKLVRATAATTIADAAAAAYAVNNR